MKWPAWILHLWEKLVLSHLSALWGSGPTSRRAYLNCPALHPCTRKCWVEVREKGERIPGLLGWIYCIFERSTGFIIVNPFRWNYGFLNTKFLVVLFKTESNDQESLGIWILCDKQRRDLYCSSKICPQTYHIIFNWRLHSAHLK